MNSLVVVVVGMTVDPAVNRLAKKIFEVGGEGMPYERSPAICRGVFRVGGAPEAWRVMRKNEAVLATPRSKAYFRAEPGELLVVPDRRL
mmetsp:Transcript_30880/g.67618  ORF Transcript_30880/g.67618 Transcript_30880/m.67618 type:complete len:89 (+) Transcript_30880:193-459(+)